MSPSVSRSSEDKSFDSVKFVKRGRLNMISLIFTQAVWNSECVDIRNSPEISVGHTSQRKIFLVGSPSKAG